MAVPITYTNFVPPAIDAGNLNTVNTVVYTVIGDGTNAPATAANVRTNIGLGTIATQNAGAVAITGGTIAGTTLSTSTIASLNTPLAVANGGTGVATQPIFAAYANASVALPSAVATEVVFNTEEYDTGNYFNPATGRFTPLVAGYYQLNTSISIGATAGFSTNCQINFFKNGVGWKRGFVVVTGSNDMGSLGGGLSTTVFLNGTTDFVSVYVFSQLSAGTQVVVGDAAGSFSWFNGHFIRP